MIAIEPEAVLRIDEAGRMALDFDEADDAREQLAAKYGLEVDDTLVRLGHCLDVGLPREYWATHVAEWLRLADAWERSVYGEPACEPYDWRTSR